LKVSGRTAIDGSCEFSPNGPDGSFTITSDDGKFLAKVDIVSPGLLKATGIGNLIPRAHALSLVFCIGKRLAG
jgi:hypothetical protein